ncbi:MAG TPA: hypothetical protein VHN99_09765, partial [Deinococcales bacterium]|nr:hypothetical protein [Deinococcales bacterium]
FVARGIRRSTLYLPFGARVYRELLLESERACDAAGVEAVGRKHYAQALLDFAEAGARPCRARAVPTALAFGPGEAALSLLAVLPFMQVLATRTGGAFLTQRLEALLRPREGGQHVLAFWASFGAAYLALVFLH